MSEHPNRSPIRRHMLGMVWNANYALEQALDPNTKNVPRELFEKCHGIVLMSTVKAGVVFTGNVGTGIMMAKTEDGNWSPPVSVSSVGYSFGAILGKRDDDILIFIMDKKSMEEFVKMPQTRMGVTAALNIGRFGGQVSQGLELPNKGTITVSFSKGIFTGGGIDVGTLETTRDEVNETFYKQKAKASQILFKKGAVTIPEESMVPDIHEKLQWLAEGKTWTPGAEDIDRSSHYLSLALHAEGELAKTESKK